MTAPVTANPMASTVRLTLPLDAVAGLLATLAVELRHGSGVVLLLEDLATTANDLAKDPAERETSWDAACLAHEVALAALLAALGPVTWEMPGTEALRLGADLTVEAWTALGFVHCTGCEVLVHSADAVWEELMFGPAEPYCTGPCRDTHVGDREEAAATRAAS